MPTSRIARSSRSRTTSSVSAIAIKGGEVRVGQPSCEGLEDRRSVVGGCLEDAPKLGDGIGAERGQVGAEVGVLLEGISHWRSSLSEGLPWSVGSQA